MMKSTPIVFVAIVLLGACLGSCGGAGKRAAPTPPISSTATSGTTTTTTNSATVAALNRAPGLRQLNSDGDDDNDTPTSEQLNGKNDGDSDYDNDAIERKGFYDRDDSRLTGFGHAADAADSRAIAALVKRYYAAALAGDGAVACSMMTALFAEAVPEDFGKGAGPRYSRGNTCPVVATKLLKHLHGQLPRRIVVVGARVEGNRGEALVGSRTTPASAFALRRERGVWKVEALLASVLS